MPKRKRKDHGPTEWAEEIRNLREKLGISQGELARKLDCSAMTVSRWENGQLAPTARYYIELGKLAGKQECWFYWGRAGLQTSDIMHVLTERERKQIPARPEEQMEFAAAGGGAKQDATRRPKVLRVRGHSMEPLIHDGDIAAVDSSQTDRADLDGKVVIVTNEDKGLCVSRLRRYPKFDILESENREYQAVVLGKSSGWRIIARVLWWISAAP